MSLLDRMESGLQRTLNGVFARAFRSEVQPVELASGVRGAMDTKAATLQRGYTTVPNIYRIELSPGDYERLAPIEEGLRSELIAAADEHAETQHYTAPGPIDIHLITREDLETGVYRIITATSRPPSRRVRANETPGVQPTDAPYQSTTAAAAPAPRRSAPTAPPAANPTPAAAQASTPSPPPILHDPADRPWLLIDGERYPLIGAICVIGRDDTAGIILDDLGISRRHAELRVTVDGPHLITSIRDLGSTNGTLVNGERIHNTQLRDGDRLTIGRTTMTFSSGRRK